MQQLWQMTALRWASHRTNGVKGRAAGDPQHIVPSLLIILCCLSNKAGQCDRYAPAQLQTATGQRGDVE